jgi:hypothetical protein
MKNVKAQWTLSIAAVAGVLDWVAGFGWHALTPAEAGWWVTAVSAVAGVVASLKTRPIAPQVWTYAVTALAGLGTAYGLHFNQGSVGAFSTALLAVLALLTHGQVSPASDTPVSSLARGGEVR